MTDNLRNSGSADTAFDSVKYQITRRNGSFITSLRQETRFLGVNENWNGKLRQFRNIAERLQYVFPTFLYAVVYTMPPICITLLKARKPLILLADGLTCHLLGSFVPYVTG